MSTNEKTTPGLSTTYPYEAVSPGVARHQCDECGHWQRADKADKGLLVGEILHAKHCDSKPQIPSVAESLAKRDADKRGAELRRFAEQVKRTGLTKGRDADVAECVRLGFLSATDAQNVDD